MDQLKTSRLLDFWLVLSCCALMLCVTHKFTGKKFFQNILLMGGKDMRSMVAVRLGTTALNPIPVLMVSRDIQARASQETGRQGQMSYRRPLSSSCPFVLPYRQSQAERRYQIQEILLAEVYVSVCWGCQNTKYPEPGSKQQTYTVSQF